MTCRTCTPFYHCDVGDNLWLAEIAAQAEYDKAQRDLALALTEHVDTRPLEDRLHGAQFSWRLARAAYDHHLGVGDLSSHTLELALERVFGDSAFPTETAIIATEILRLAQAAGEPPPAVLVRLCGNQTRPLTYTATTPPPLYTVGVPQEDVA